MCKSTPALGKPGKKTTQATKSAVVATPNPFAGLIFSEECGNVEKIEKALGTENGLRVIFSRKPGRTINLERCIIAANALRKIAFDAKKPKAISKLAANGLHTIAFKFQDLYEEKISDLTALSKIPTEELKDTGDALEAIIPQWNASVAKESQISEKKQSTLVALFKTVIDYDLTDTLCRDWLTSAQSITDLKRYLTTNKEIDSFKEYRSLSYSPKLIQAMYNTQYRRLMADHKVSAEKKELYKNFIISQLTDELDSLAGISRQKGTPYEKIVASAKSASVELAIPYALKVAQELGHTELFTTVASHVEKEGENGPALKTLLLNIVQDVETKKQLVKTFLEKSKQVSIEQKNIASETPKVVQARYDMSVWQSAIAYVKSKMPESLVGNYVSALPKEVEKLLLRSYMQPFQESIEDIKLGKRQTANAPLMTTFRKLLGQRRISPLPSSEPKSDIEIDMGEALN